MDNDYQYWSKTADHFDAASTYIVGAKTQGAAASWLKSQVATTDVVLEIGCGTGFFSSVIAERVQHLTATDMSLEMLAQARGRLQAYPNAEVQAADGYRTRYADQSFDVVFMGNVVHIVREPLAVLREAHRLLKPEGRLLLIDSTMKGMSGTAQLAMALRYLSQYGLPPRTNKNYSLEELVKVVEGMKLTLRDGQSIARETRVLCLCAVKI